MDEKVSKETAAIHRDCVSPELVLIDPELARSERARLVEAAALAARIESRGFDAEQLRRAVESAGAPLDDVPARRVRSWRPTHRLRLVLAGCLLVSLFVNGVVLAAVVAEPEQHGAPAAAPPPPSKPSTPLPPKARLERGVLLALVRSPAGLPTALLDPTTGLARRNLRVSCRHVREARYICGVRAPGTSRRLRLSVRYRRGRILEISARVEPVQRATSASS